MRKIYNEVIIDMNPESPTFEQTLYEDSYEHDGEMMLMITEDELLALKGDSAYNFKQEYGPVVDVGGTIYYYDMWAKKFKDSPISSQGDTFMRDSFEQMGGEVQNLDDISYEDLDPTITGVGKGFDIENYKEAQKGGPEGLKDYFGDLGISGEDYDKYFKSGMNKDYLDFSQQQRDISEFGAEGAWTAAQNQRNLATTIGAEGYRAGQADYTTGKAELAEMYRSGQTSYDIGMDIGAEALRSGRQDISIGRQEAREAFRTGEESVNIGMAEMAEGRTAAASAYDLAGMSMAEGMRGGTEASRIAELSRAEGLRSGTEAYDIATTGAAESYRIGGLEIGEALRAGTSAYDIGQAGVAETRRVAEEQYGFGRERGERAQQRGLISLGEAAGAGASRAGFAGGGTGARMAERARGNLWEDFGQQQKELEAAKAGTLARADLQAQGLESQFVGTQARYGEGGIAQAQRDLAQTMATRQAENQMTSTTAQYGAGGIAASQAANAMAAVEAQYGEGGIAGTARDEAQRAAGAQYGTFDAATGELTQGFGGQRLQNQMTGLTSRFGEYGTGGTTGARLSNQTRGLLSQFGGPEGGTYGRGLANQLSGVTSVTGVRNRYGDFVGGTGQARNESAWTGTQSQFGKMYKGKISGGTYAQQADINYGQSSNIYEQAMGGETLGTGQLGLNYERSVSDYYQGIEDEYWDMLNIYESQVGG